MDAVMVVHQLQRLATASPPSASLLAKLPRVAVGICYFIDHPELGVRQQAANAVKAVALRHFEILRLTCCGDLNDSCQPTTSSSTDDRMQSHETPASSSSSTGKDGSSSSSTGKDGSSSSSTGKDGSSGSSTGKDGSSSSSSPAESSDRDACSSSSSRSEDTSHEGSREGSSSSERNSRSGSGEERSGAKDSGRSSSSSTEGPVPGARTERNLITLLQRHVDSEDAVVRDCCRAALQALLQPAKAAAGRRETPVAAPAPAAADAAPPLPSEAAGAAEENSVAARSASPAAARGNHPAAVAAAAAGSAQTPAADLSARPLQTSQQEQQNQPSETAARPQGSAECVAEVQSSCAVAAARTADPAAARPSSSSSTVRYTPLEGELCTVLLGLRGLLGQHEGLLRLQQQQPQQQQPQQQQPQQQQGGCLSAGAEATAEPGIKSCHDLEKLRKVLQYRLVRVPGVSSVTITLNTRYLQQQLLLRERRQRALQLRGYSSSGSSSTHSAAKASSETGDCSSSPVTSSKCTAAPSLQQGEDQQAEKQPQDCETEGDGVAVLLMRLPSPPKKRLRALQAVKEVCGPLTLVLRATRVYEHRKVAARSRRTGSKCCAAAGASDGVNLEQQQDARCCSREEAEEVEEEAARNGRGAAGCSAVVAAAARPAYLDDEQQSDSRPAAAAAAGDSRYSSKKEDDESFSEQQADAAEGTRERREWAEGEEFCGWAPTAAGFSFFSRNSAIFSQSRHLRSHLLPYEEDERRVAARLKKEKEIKQQMQRERAARESVLDRVLNNIGRGVFW